MDVGRAWQDVDVLRAWQDVDVLRAWQDVDVFREDMARCGYAQGCGKMWI